jgi:hypothetical protein
LGKQTFDIKPNMYILSLHMGKKGEYSIPPTMPKNLYILYHATSYSYVPDIEDGGGGHIVFVLSDLNSIYCPNNCIIIKST